MNSLFMFLSVFALVSMSSCTVCFIQFYLLANQVKQRLDASIKLQRLDASIIANYAAAMATTRLPWIASLPNITAEASEQTF